MSETEKIIEIYNRNVFLPSQNNICGIVTKDNAAYKCPSNKFCNYGGLAGICENTDCMPDAFVNKPINMDHRKFDGDGVSRIVDVSGNIKSLNCDRKISTDGKCGLNNNSTKCPDGQCCSLKGTCGYDKESCLYIGPRYNNNNPFAQFISPYYNDFSNNLIATLNREFYSKYGDVRKYEEEFIEQIGKKYVGNNNFEMSTDGKCGLDLEKEKIIKCPDIQYCGRNSKCSTDYNNYNTPSDNIYLNFPDLSLNLMHGNKFNEEYNKRYDNSQNAIPSNTLDCNNKKILDSFKTFYYEKMGGKFKIVDIVKINKVNNNTCDIKYNFEGNISGQNSRRIIYQYKPDKGYVCTEIGGRMSGLTTLPLDSQPKFFISHRTIIGMLIFIGIIALIIFYNKNHK